jgi:hypothetical protein
MGRYLAEAHPELELLFEPPPPSPAPKPSPLVVAAAASGALGRADLVVWEAERIRLLDFKHAAGFSAQDLASYRDQLSRYAEALTTGDRKSVGAWPCDVERGSRRRCLRGRSRDRHRPRSAPEDDPGWITGIDGASGDHPPTRSRKRSRRSLGQRPQ